MSLSPEGEGWAAAAVKKILAELNEPEVSS